MRRWLDFDRPTRAMMRRQAPLCAAVAWCCLASTATTADPLDQASPDGVQIHRDLALAEARMAIAEADAVPAHSTKARLAAARIRLSSLSGPEIADCLARLDRALARLGEDTHERADKTARSQALADLANARAQDQSHQQDILATRIERIRGMVERGHVELALAHSRRLVSDFPAEPTAEALFNEVLARAHDQRRLTIDERRGEALQELNARIEREMLPTGFDGLPRFPGDWEQRTTNRAKISNVNSAIPEWQEKLEARLAERVSIAYDQQLPADVLHDLGARSQLNLLLDPAVSALDKPISVKANNLTLNAALSWVCQLSGVTWRTLNGAIYVGGTTDEPPVMDRYDVAELMFQGKDQPGRAFGMGNSGGAGGGQGPNTNLLATPTQDSGSAALTPEAIVEMVKKSVSPETWTNNPACGIVAHSSTLLVTAPPRVHALIRQFLRSRSGLQTVLVSIEARWLQIDDGYLEEIGVEWNSTSSSAVSTGSPYGLSYRNDTSAITGSTTNIMPPSMGGFAASAPVNAGLNLTAAVLKTAQLNAVLHAVESNQRGTVLGAPTLATTNGVRSSCFFGSQQAYISDYDIMAYAYSPKISVLNVGATLDLKPYVSADGRYVTMELKPQIADAQMYQETLIAYQIENTTTVTPGLIIIGPQPVPKSYTLQLPMVRLKAAATTVRIPDRGTLVIGGFGRGLDQQSSTKVPFLGHIPFLGRLFGARGRYSDRRQVYLLTTVHVINYQELEATL